MSSTYSDLEMFEIVSVDIPKAKKDVRKRSVVWRFFTPVNSDSVQCLLCSGFQSRKGHGSTTAMLRHLRLKHPTEVGRKCKGLMPGSTDAHSDTETDGAQFCSVEVALEDNNTGNSTIVNGCDIDGTVEAAEGGLSEKMTQEGANNGDPVTHRGHKRSLIWRYFSRLDGLDSALCHLCMKTFQCCDGGGTGNLRRHMSKRHPEVFSRLLAEGGNQQPANSAASSKTSGDASASPETVEATEQRVFSVEVTLEDEESKNPAAVNKPDIAMVNGSVEAAQEGHAEPMQHKETSATHPVTQRRHTRSLIWKHFEHFESLDGARCHICMKRLQCFRGGSTSNLRRHMSKRHPEAFSRLLAEGGNQQPANSAASSKTSGDASASPETVEATEQRVFSVEVTLEDEESENPAAVNKPDIAMVNGSVEAAQEGHAEPMQHKETSATHPVTQRRHTRSLIWRHFEHLESLDGARCRICMKRLQCFRGGGTSNLRRHMSKRHPEVFSRLLAEGGNRQSSGSILSLNDETWTQSETVGVATQRLFSGSRVPDGKDCVWRREWELIEALRRAQKQEAQALEHQRELLEKLRAADAREAAAEREKIGSLRKAQEEEAKDLKRQQIELQKEKDVLQKKWEEFQLEREKLLLFPKNQ